MNCSSENFCRNFEMNCAAFSAIFEIALHCCLKCIISVLKYKLFDFSYRRRTVENRMTLIAHFHLLGKLNALKTEMKVRHKTKANPVANKYIYVKSVYGVVNRKAEKWREIQWYWWLKFICYCKGWASRSQSTSDINLFAHIVGHTIGSSSAISLFGIQFSVDAVCAAPIAPFIFFWYFFPISLFPSLLLQ